jgi:hypothetical protein
MLQCETVFIPTLEMTMNEPLLQTIPTCSKTAAEFLNRYEQASYEEVSQLADRIAGMTQDELALFEYYVIPLSFDEKLLELVCASPELLAHTSYLRISGILTQLYIKQDSLLIEPGVYDHLAASLISLYPNKKNINFLESLHQIVRKSHNKPHHAGPLLDEALSKHAEKSPSLNFAGMARAMDNLRDIVLPKTLAVFLRQSLANDGMTNIIPVFVSELFRLNNLHDAYIDVFMKELGAQTFIDICIEAQHIEPCLASTLKLIPFAGEAAFHDAAFFEAQLKTMKGAQSTYLEEFIDLNPDAQQIPLLNQFVLENLGLMLESSPGKRLVNNALGVVQVAMRNGHAEQAMSHVLEGLRAPLSFNMNDVSALSRTQLLDHLTSRVSESWADPRHKEIFSFVQSVVAIVGLEVLQKVAPTVDYRFIQEFTQTHETSMTRGQVMKLFPHIKGPVLEDELGL